MAARTRQRSLFALEETTVVPDEELKGFLARVHERGGRLRKSLECTQDGKPAFAVTIGWVAPPPAPAAPPAPPRPQAPTGAGESGRRSSGRKAVALADLQRAASDGFLEAVHKALLGEFALVDEHGHKRGHVADQVKDAPADLLLSADIDQDAYGKPADFAYRTTFDDMRRMVEERACDRLALWYIPLVKRLVWQKPIPHGLEYTSAEATQAASVVREVFREVLKEVPKDYRVIARAPKLRHEPRMDAPCSKVVQRFTATGRVYVGGKQVSEEEAAAALRMS